MNQKSLFLCLAIVLLFKNIVFTQSTNKNVLEIQVAAYTSLRPSDFKAIKSLGYLYELKQPNGVSKIILGVFDQEKDLKSKLIAVKKRGFKDAFIIRTKINPDDNVTVIQLGSYGLKDTVAWTRYNGLSKDIMVQLGGGRVRIVSGPYKTAAEANENKQKFIKLGIKDAFITKINPNFTHPVTTFETGDEAAESAELYIDKKSIMSLQEALQAGGYYTGAIDGDLGQLTKDALDRHKNENSKYQAAHRLGEVASNMVKPVNSVETGTIQYFVDIIGDKPAEAEAGLQEIEQPIAKIYLAYLYLTKTRPAPENVSFNQLLNDAMTDLLRDYKGATRYDYTQRYSYEAVELFVTHLPDFQLASRNEIAIPCWLFKAHAAEMQKAFAPYWGNDKDNYKISAGCFDELKFEELETLRELASAIDVESESDKSEKLRAESQLLATWTGSILTMPQPLSAAEGTELTKWETALWTGLDAMGAQSPLQLKYVQTFKICYYEALIKLEYLFLQKSVAPSGVRSLGMKVIKAYIYYYLNHLCKA